ncbi:MAG: ATP-dependent DNA helicase [Verrucomicrobiota bacterium]
MSALQQQIKQIFSPTGVLSHADGFEYRPQQQQMAVAIAQDLEDEKHLIVEAPTGVGKTLGYLIPAIIYGLKKKKQVVISTHTIALQEQILSKDIPQIRKILPKPLQVLLIKGRQNYLCLNRLHHVMRNSKDQLTISDQMELRRIEEWASKTTDGTLSDLNPQPKPSIWNMVCSQKHFCARNCRKEQDCFYEMRLAQKNHANVVILNHALFFSSMGTWTEEDENVRNLSEILIFDEAHTIHDVAAEHLGFHLSPEECLHLLLSLYHPQTHTGSLTPFRRPQIEKLVVQVLRELQLCFSLLAQQCQFSENTFRFRTPPQNIPVPSFMRLRNELLNLSKEEFSEYAEQLESIYVKLLCFLQQTQKDFVYWAEREDFQNSQPALISPQNISNRISLHAVPIDCSSILRRSLFGENQTTICTSATLSINNNFNYFQSSLGAESARTLRLNSPFNFQKQMKVFAVRDMPDPKNEKYQEALLKWIPHFIAQTEGKALVLFTNKKLLLHVADELSDFFRKNQIELLIQNGKISRYNLLQRFKKNVGSVLFGVDSFWQGIDVPGEALSNLILTRLPFRVPFHPLHEARCEKIQQDGGNPFYEYSLPQAVLKFKQGIGRLIRSKNDAGQIVILDSRIFHPRFGAYFQSAIPVPVKQWNILETPHES